MRRDVLQHAKASSAYLPVAYYAAERLTLAFLLPAVAPLAPKAPLPHLSAPAKRARRSPSPSNEAEQQDAFAFAGGARSAPGQLNAHPLAAPRAANGLRTASRLGPAAVGNDGNGNGDAQMQRRLSFGDACDATPTPLATKTFIKVRS